MLSRITVAICESMAGVGSKRRLLSGGTEFLAISGIIYVYICFHGYFFGVTTYCHFPWLQLFLPGIEGEVFTRRREEFPS